MSSADADLRACRALLRQGSRTFFAASLLLPRYVRDPASALYAFCRVADDAVDIGGRKDALAQLRRRLHLAYAGRPLASPVDRAFADVVARHDIPRSLPAALLEGLAWDAAGVRYETFADLEAYAARVAGTVGVMMAILMGRRHPEAIARASALGVAMQLTNIARDVGEDARNGRLYLPQQWMREAGIEPQRWLAQPQFHSALGSVVGRLIQAADVHYERAASGVDLLPLACRPGIHAARLLYADIGREVERQGLDSVTRRAVISGWRKTRLLSAALAASCVKHPRQADPSLAATQFLILAATANPGPSYAHRAEPAPRGAITGKAIWMLELFERLERRQGA